MIVAVYILICRAFYDMMTKGVDYASKKIPTVLRDL